MLHTMNFITVLVCFIFQITPTIGYVERIQRLSDPEGLYARRYPQLEDVRLQKDYVQGTVTPKPQKEERSDRKFPVVPNKFEFKIMSEDSKNSSILSSACQRYLSLTLRDLQAPVPKEKHKIKSLDVMVDDMSETLSEKMVESYKLVISEKEQSLHAPTIWGALRGIVGLDGIDFIGEIEELKLSLETSTSASFTFSGLETFSQLVFQHESRAYYINEVTIEDYPRFSHRGFLIDTSRHFLPVKTIMKFLDAMSYAKFNVLHWHMVDDPSFPFESTTFPQLHKQGAFNPTTHVYRPADVANVIQYARMRGIRVMPEFDTPGHTQSWHGIEGLLTECSGNLPASSVNGRYGPVNPTREFTYTVLRKFMAEIATRFPDKYMHIGGDEVDFACWKADSNINAWMDQFNMSGNYKKLEEYFVNRVISMAEKLNKTAVVWQEVFDNKVKLGSNVIVNVWIDGWKSELANVTKAGYKAILSSCWYLNYIHYGLDWLPLYECDPHNFNGTKEQKELVIGGTAAMWGEYVDATNIIPRTWARGLPVAERLWSDKNVKDIEDALRRFWEHRCRYLERGLPAEDILKSKFCRREWEA